MPSALDIAERIARTSTLADVVGVCPTTKELYGYDHFVVDQVVLYRRVAKAIGDVDLDTRVEAFNYAYDIVESRLERCQA